MSIVLLASGGIDSTVLAKLYLDEGREVWPIFIDYGQLASDREWAACKAAMAALRTRSPIRVDMSGFGEVISSGLTNGTLDVNKDAFLPCRNLLLLTVAGGYGFLQGVDTIAIGLLNERAALFPDQSRQFLDRARDAIVAALGSELQIDAPLAGLSKAEVLILAEGLGIPDTYSCHTGNVVPCGSCVACLEILRAKGE